MTVQPGISGGDAVDQVPVVLARMEVKLDQVLKAVQDHEARLRAVEGGGAQAADHEKRIRALERLAWRTAGAGGALGLAAGLLGSWIQHK